MTEQRGFWYSIQALLLVFYAVVLLLALQGSHVGSFAVIALVLLVIHLCELPHALRLLSGRGIPTVKLVVATLLFGLAWWWPVDREILPG